jgi:FAD/FMN-containing dehydrogenase
MRPMSSWGRLSAQPHHTIALHPGKDLGSILAANRPGLAFGMGRSYGDVCLNPGGTLWDTTGLDHFVDFDENTGQLTCETGVVIRDIQRLVIPRGWILPVTPGTQLLTVGGAIANDIHGKNFHTHASFGNHLNSLTLARTDGEIFTCGPGVRPDWFAATIGGVGLTGIIVQAEIQLRRVESPWLDTETIAYERLENFFELANDSLANWEHSVSWIDCLSGRGGRGIFNRANPAPASDTPEPASRKFVMPMVPPFSLVNRLSLRPFNTAYFHLKKRQAARTLAHYESSFYPLDSVIDWNRMYGPRGFYQHQSVIPVEAGQDPTRAMLEEIAKSGEGSFLAVLKIFGDNQSVGMLSFPRPGVTLALDLPNKGAGTENLLRRLDAIVRESGGRIYLAKDACMSAEVFEAGYPRLNEFLQYRDPGISSELSRRLMGS